MLRLFSIAAMALIVCGCSTFTSPAKDKPMSFKSDVDFLAAHIELVVLSDASGQSRVAVSPAWQGRVMTSTASGDDGLSFGWINRELIASKKIQPHINVFGGEDRFWLGPEGGPFSIFFEKGKEQNLTNWQTPPAIDTQPFDVVSKAPDKAVFRRQMNLKNASGTTLSVQVDRAVKLLPGDQAWKTLSSPKSSAVKIVAYQTENTIKNTGKEPWTKHTGLLSVWILGMFNPSPGTTIVIPFKKGPESALGPVVNDVYFGKVPAERLKVDEQAGVIYFSADGKFRSKIGLSPRRAKSVAGSYDADNKVLTLVQFEPPADMSKVSYVNSVWGDQKDSFAGDVINSYNDGPPEPGKKPMGPFYELETSSPGAALAPSQSLTHIHRTIHIQGEDKDLEPIARAVLGVGLDQIKHGLNR